MNNHRSKGPLWVQLLQVQLPVSVAAVMDGIVTWHTVQCGGTMCSFSVNPVWGARVETPIPKLTVTDQSHGELWQAPFFTWMLILRMVLRTGSISIIVVEYLFSLFNRGKYLFRETLSTPLNLNIRVNTMAVGADWSPGIRSADRQGSLFTKQPVCPPFSSNCWIKDTILPFSLWIGGNICSTDFYEVLNMHNNSKECHLWSPVIRN